MAQRFAIGTNLCVEYNLICALNVYTGNLSKRKILQSTQNAKW
jgi:hypothetical protein